MTDIVERLRAYSLHPVTAEAADEIERLRAALASKSAPAIDASAGCVEPVSGWLEAAVAWEVCASIHETWAKGKDALYKTRHADFVRHADDARKKHAAPQQRGEPVTDGLSPLEALRFFCSQHLPPHAWLDSEPLFAAVEAAPQQRQPMNSPDNICDHGIHWDNACGACVPPRGTK